MASFTWQSHLYQFTFSRQQEEADAPPYLHKQFAYSSTRQRGEPETDGLPLLVFPFVCTGVGMVCELLAKHLKFGTTKLPGTVAQFLISVVLSLTAYLLLSADTMVNVERYVWVVNGLPPDGVLKLLLPILIFEAAFKMNNHAFMSNLVTITCMAFACYLIAFVAHSLLLWVALYDKGPGTTLAACALFASMISATDPVAVVALLEELGAPYRLRVIIEGESLINDGLAIIMFRVCKAWWTIDECHFDVDASQLLFMALGSIASAPIGIVSGKLCVWVVTVAFEAGQKQKQAALFLFVYGTWLLTESAHGSGVIGIVAFGQTLSANKFVMSSKTVREATAIWEFLGYTANCIIFILAGFFVGRSLVHEYDLMNLHWAMQAFFLFPIGLAARTLAVCIFASTYKPAMRPPATHFVCYVWGALRGALPLLLCFECAEAYHKAIIHHTIEMEEHIETAVERLTMLAVGSVVFSLLLQGLTFETLLVKFGLTRETQYVTKLKLKVKKRISRLVGRQISKMQLEPSLAGTNWDYVKDTIDYVWGASLGQIHSKSQQSVQRYTAHASEEQEPIQDTMSGVSLAVFQPLKHDTDEDNEAAFDESWADETLRPTDAESEKDMNMVYMKLLLARVQRDWEENIVSPRVIDYLTNLLESCMDIGSAIQVERFCLTMVQQQQSTHNFKRRFHDTLQPIVAWLRKWNLVHPHIHQNRYFDYFYLLFTVLCVAYAAACVRFYKIGPELPFFVVILIYNAAAVMEMVVIYPYERDRARHSNRNRVYLIGRFLVVLLNLMMIVWPLADADREDFICFVSVNETYMWQPDVADMCPFCLAYRHYALAVPLLTAAVKVCVALPLLLYVVLSFVRNSLLEHFRVFISALETLKRITESLTIDRFEFGNTDALRHCAVINAQIINMLEVIYKNEVLYNAEHYDQMQVIRTRYAIRRVLHDAVEELQDRADRGIISHDDVHDILEHVEGARMLIFSVNHVTTMPATAQALRSPLLMAGSQNDNAIADFVETDFEFAIQHVYQAKEVVTTNDRRGLWFLHSGVVFVTNTKHARKKRKLKMKTKLESSDEEHVMKCTGQWLNEFDMLDHYATETQLNLLTECKVHVMSPESVEQLLEQDPDHRIIEHLVKRICAWKLRHPLRHGRYGHMSEAQFWEQLSLFDVHVVDHKKQLTVAAKQQAIVLAGTTHIADADALYDKHLFTSDDSSATSTQRQRPPKLRRSIDLWSYRVASYSGPIKIQLEPRPPVRVGVCVIVPRAAVERLQHQHQSTDAAGSVPGPAAVLDLPGHFLFSGSQGHFSEGFYAVL